MSSSPRPEHLAVVVEMAMHQRDAGLRAQDLTLVPAKKRTRSNTSTWKAIELKLAKLLGGERVPVTGRTMGSAPDIDHPDLAIEVKHGRQVPKLLIKAMAQAVAARTFYLKRGKGDRVPFVVFHPEGARIDESFAIVRICDLKALQSIQLPEEVE